MTLLDRRDGYYDDNGYWQRTKMCFIYCGARCTCSPPNGAFYSKAHDKRIVQDNKDSSSTTLKRYNVWGGNPKGVAYNPDNCAEEVYSRIGVHSIIGGLQCSRPKGHGQGNLYCKQHAKQHPSTENLVKEEHY